jgi:soluble lytic murein transglycosylase-like protein
VSLPETETPGMPPRTVKAVSRALTQVRSRRLAFTALLAVAVPSSADAGKRCRKRASEREIRRYIEKAARKYNQSEKAMLRVARCESNLDPCAVNTSGPYYGLFQFLKSTWKSTPYGDQDIYDPKAQALAAGWMWKQGRKDEWACK